MELCKYVNDRVELIQQVFLTMKSSKIKAMVPECLRDCELNEIKELLLEELLGISRKRLISILKGAECPSNTESSDSDDSDVEFIDNVSIGEIPDESEENDLEINEEDNDDDDDAKEENNELKDEDKDIFVISDTDSHESAENEDSNDSISNYSIQSHVTLNSESSNREGSCRTSVEDKSNLESESPIVLYDSEDSKNCDTPYKENIDGETEKEENKTGEVDNIENETEKEEIIENETEKEVNIENEMDKEENSNWTSRWLSSSKMKRVLVTSKIYNDIRKKKKREKQLNQSKEHEYSMNIESNNDESNITEVNKELEGSVAQYNDLIK